MIQIINSKYAIIYKEVTIITKKWFNILIRSMSDNASLINSEIPCNHQYNTFL